MEFTGAQSIGILNRQRLDCLVEIGREFVEPAAAAKIAANGSYIGVGHYKCIKYLRPLRLSRLWREAMPKHIPAKISGYPQAKAQLHGRGVLHGGRDIGYENSDPDGVRSAFKIDEERRRQDVQYQIEPPTAVVERERVQQDLRARYISKK